MLLRQRMGLWVVLLGASAAHAEAAGSFLEGARLASLVHSSAQAGNAPSSLTSRDSADSRVSAKETRWSSDGRAASPTGTQAVTTGTATSGTPSPKDDDAPTSQDVRSVLTLVVALALVGWMQRRRPDA
ncbi:hypothetical protein [Roseateles amylovorans]|uniref:MYXO-CTERM domain-containing protein n=1 Tax=Roseateles amylovorans TaxID=2978473 RepID=A0ABY6BBG1_9BURK|nr:hypothetical protein [Roseateles amylovorans]UXH80527.1 hypothetical protein N4261_11915 [Roseateles amylovorans]